MAKVITLLVCILFVNVSYSEEKQYRNSLGWDDGLSYRYNFKNHYFLGMSIFGSYHKKMGYNSNSFQYQPQESYYNTVSDSVNTYDVNFNIKLGREILTVKWMKVNFFISPYVDYTWQNRKNSNAVGKYEYKNYLLGGTIGFEPAFTLFRRFTFGSKFGLDCNYQRTESHDLQVYLNRSQTTESKSDDRDYNFRIFGTNFSTSLHLFGLVNF
jgi:hypothetical protein